MITPHLRSEGDGYCRLCDAPPTSHDNHCHVAHAFEAWLNKSVMGTISIRSILTDNERDHAMIAFTAGWNAKRNSP